MSKRPAGSRDAVPRAAVRSVSSETSRCGEDSVVHVARTWFECAARTTRDKARRGELDADKQDDHRRRVGGAFLSGRLHRTARVFINK